MRAHLFAPLLAFLFSSTLITGCATNEEKQSSEQQLYERAQSALDNRAWQTAVQALETLEEHYPFGTFGDQAQLELIYAHYQSGDFELSIATADRFIRLHPQHRYADYAFYLRGLASFNKEKSLTGSIFGTDSANRDPGAASTAFDLLSDFVTRYPNSPYAPDAEQRMIHLRNLLARSEIFIANYYFTRHAYIAAANRGRYVVENFQETPAVPDALAVVIQAYKLLGDEELGANTLSVLKQSYPNYPALNADGSFNYNYAKQLNKPGILGYLTLGLFNKQQQLGFDTRKIYNPAHAEFAEAPAPK